MNQLEFVPTSELLQELLDRETFTGVIVASNQEDKGQPHGDFNVYTCMHIEDAAILLEIALDAVHQKGQSHGSSET